MIFLISVSSTALSCAAVISPLSRLARASFSGAERRMLPTWSARNGGLVLGIDLKSSCLGDCPSLFCLCDGSGGTRHHSSVGAEMLLSRQKKHCPGEDSHGVQEP